MEQPVIIDQEVGELWRCYHDMNPAHNGAGSVVSLIRKLVAERGGHDYLIALKDFGISEEQWNK